MGLFPRGLQVSDGQLQRFRCHSAFFLFCFFPLSVVFDKMEGGVSANRAMKVVSILLALLILGLSGTLVGLIGRSLYYIDHNFLHT